MHIRKILNHLLRAPQNPDVIANRALAQSVVSRGPWNDFVSTFRWAFPYRQL